MWLAAVLLLAAPPGSALEEQLGSRDSIKRGRAAFVAARMTDLGDTGELSATLTRLKKGKPEIRSATLRGLTYRPAPDPLPRALEAAILESLKDRDATVVMAALDAIAELEPAGAADALAPLLVAEGRSPRGAGLRRALLLAVGRTGDPKLGEPLMKLYETSGGGGRRDFPFGTPPGEIFLAAAADLGLPEAKLVVDANFDLIQAGPDGDYGSLSISETFRDLGRTILRVRADPRLQIWVARAGVSVLKDPEPALAFLETTMRAQDWRLREEAALALASVPEGPARDRAVQILANAREDQLGRIRAVVVQTLSRESTSVTALLVDALDDPYPDLRAEAALGLADAGLAPAQKRVLKATLEKETDPIAAAALEVAVKVARAP